VRTVAEARGGITLKGTLDHRSTNGMRGTKSAWPSSCAPSLRPVVALAEGSRHRRPRRR
jgi:hypothetical protein